MLTKSAFDVEKVRKDFPILSTEMNGHPLAYLDNAATTQKPLSVINRITDFYKNEYATVSRGVYILSQNATQECHQVRERCGQFLNVKDRHEIIFVRGTTEAINLVAASYGRKFLNSGDEIILSTIEHHANIVPWRRLADEKGLTIKVIPVTDEGELMMEEYKKLLTDKTKLVAVGHVSNALGTVNPIKEITRLAHEVGAKVLIDGAQGAPHAKVDVQDIDCDFYCFSGHKIYGPTGVGVLYGKLELLEAMDPYQGGGEMIEMVTFDKVTYNKVPHKFEAGTIAIAEIVALGPALDYIENLGLDQIAAYESELLEEATRRLSEMDDIILIGTAKHKAAVLSFEMKDVHPHDIGTILDQHGVAVRTGHHCAQPTMRRFNVPATARASFAFYNNQRDVDMFVEALDQVRKVFR